MKKLIAFVLAMACVVGLVSCSRQNMTFDIGGASSIRIKSGLTGDEVTTADEEWIRKITDNIESLGFERTAPSEGDGYVYLLTWLDSEEKEIAAITITEENGYQIRHDGYVYKVGADLNIDTGLISEMLEASGAAPD
jgi:hypothetical protein